MVHGLWYGSLALFPLGRKLQGLGFSVRHFKYAATSDKLETHARELHRFAMREKVQQQHFLGHSLGGLVILRMLADADNLPAGRVVLLGSPLGGSSVARKASGIPGSAKLLGQVSTALEHGFSTLPSSHETGMIAGSRSFGLGMFTGGTDGPGDGTVGLHEAHVEGLKDRLVLPLTHTGMLFAAEVAIQSAAFLNSGHFETPGASD